MKNWTTVSDKHVYDDDLNELVASANLTFANAAARDAFLVGDLAPVPGVTVYMQDDFVTYKRIRVGGVDYWAPAPGTHVLCIGQTVNGSSASQPTSATDTPTQLALTQVKTRNLNNWWANNRFTPPPGFYELDAMLTFTGEATDGYRAAWLSINGTSVASAIPGSRGQLFPGGNSPVAANVFVTVQTRSVCCYLNGTDYVTLMGMHGSTATTLSYVSVQGPNANPTYGCTFTAKSLGP